MAVIILTLSFFFLLALTNFFKAKEELDALKQKHDLLKKQISELEQNAKDEANKNIILQSLLNQRDYK